ncbi:KOW domain-containing RNA-binding protein [Vallitaleaceae bacterium 9-2]
MCDIKKGQIVYSKAGRDKGKCFVILEHDHPFVYLVDGKSRRLENPKKKKELHIQITHYVDMTINELLENGKRITNAEIRKSIDQFIHMDDQEF